jgi:hypothetical protein
MQFTGDDCFADKDVSSIVLEVPNFALGGKAVGVRQNGLVLFCSSTLPRS